MPFTFNGFGTVYSGKQNLRTREGVCQYCHRQVTLREYDTWVCFAAFWIPLIPIRKIHVREFCPACKMHFVAEFGQWQTLAQETLQRRHEEFLANPTPEAARGLLAAMETFAPQEEAMRFADEVGERFNDDAAVQLALGGSYERWGEQSKFSAACARALELTPDDPIARRAVAFLAIREGDPRRARELLSFMEADPERREPGMLVLLGEAFQKRQEHANALAVFRLALEAAPVLADDRKFRKTVRASERRAPGQRVLPPRSLLRSRAFRWAAIPSAVLIGGLLLANFIVAQHRTLYVTNGLGVPVQVSIDGGRPLTVPPRDFRKTHVAEGAHRALATTPGGVRDETTFKIDGFFVGRFFDLATRVLNPFGAAAIRWEKTVCSGRADPADEIVVRYHVGREFLVFRSIDLLFKESPKPTRGSNDTRAPVYLRCIAIEQASPLEVVGYMQAHQRVDPDVLLGYLEAHLAADPNAGALLSAYRTLAAGTDRVDRARRFLQQGLAAHPQRIDWQRHYQALRDLAGPNAPGGPPAAEGGRAPVGD